MKNNNPKYIIQILSTLFVLVSFSEVSSQVYPWNPLTKITFGYDDRNPSFGTKQDVSGYLFEDEFLTFERHVSDSTSYICVLKMDIHGASDSVIHITNDSNLNTNPSISYSYELQKAFVIWESLRNGIVQLYGAFYNSNNGWSPEFLIDSSSQNKLHPRSVYLNSSNFAICYEVNGDIRFVVFDAELQIGLMSLNLTSNESQPCSNPFITKTQNPAIFISYEKLKLNSEKEICFTVTTNWTNWTLPDTIAYVGDNINEGFAGSFSSPTAIFSSDRSGRYRSYFTDTDGGQGELVSNDFGVTYDFESFLFPIITDGIHYYHAAAYLCKSDSVKVMMKEYFNNQDSVTLGDSTSANTLTMNRGLKNGFDANVWVVFNKDSVGLSNLYGKSVRIIVTQVQQISSQIPVRFNLDQNYPNPFNPITKIKFDVPGNTSDVRLIIYDQLGKEVELIFDKKLSGGSYEATWNAGDLPSGVYFYKLISGDLSITKKLMLIK
ncbi:MAG: T9SS type A sorting domain-containing protein [bacterium]